MKTKKIFRCILMLSAFTAGIWGGGVFPADPQPDPPPEHGLNGNQGGGNAPIGEGLVITLSMAAAYAAKKFYSKHKKFSKARIH